MEDAIAHEEGTIEAVFAILGDPHFTEEHGSHLKIKQGGELASTNPRVNPWAGLNELVASQMLTADAILCPGDIAFQNSAITLSAGWKHLVDLGARLSSEHVICATGNHDVTSRSMADTLKKAVIRNLKAGNGPFEQLKVLHPPYPSVTRGDTGHLQGQDHRVRYFGAGLVLVSSQKYQVLIVNSCSEHGHDEFEHERGTFPPSAVEELKTALQQCDLKKISVAIMHHPPESHTQDGSGAHDFVDNGQQLLKLLADQGDWLVVHGHKHEARLGQASGSGLQPIVFGAASLAIHIEAIKGTVRNQFYLLKVRLQPRGLTGRFQTWDWSTGRGWEPAKPEGDGIYDGAAFGAREPQRVIMDIVALTALPMDWSDVIRLVPDADLLPPEARNQVRQRLRERHGLHIHVDSKDGQWTKLEKAAP
ncbi:metallophosphoesterase superfamily enzyme [Variovorax paradoxus]|uniref:metallophosphoesterase family protein n=1 Tax=Variovorax paradoxus TaxID=34073 RepID=UPI002793F755|nr:metallophosphoesterase [Variovorax paradoxus]MDQ0573720.1 metallophosphoesterase superfamily enzyme [Variovorax paradoxus]